MNEPRLTPLDVYPGFAPFVEAEWRAHQADNYANLERIPSDAIAGYCSVFRADPATGTLDTLMTRARGMDSEAERKQLLDRVQQARLASRSTGPIFLHKALLKEALRAATDDALRTRVAAALDALADVDTPKAADVRKALNGALKPLFGKPLVKSGHGDWNLDFELDGAPLQLWVDTGGMARGFCYHFCPKRGPGAAPREWFAYETLLGLPANSWDMLRTDRLDQQVALWGGLVEKLLAAMRAIPWKREPD